MIMTDLHMHVVPHVDDGAIDMKMSLEMLKMAHEQGVRKVLCTSHSSWQDEAAVLYHDNFEKLRIAAAADLPDMRLYTGCEVLFTGAALLATLRKLDEGAFLTLNGTKLVLTEFWPDAPVDEAGQVVNELLSRKYVPVIAHAERCAAFEDEVFVKRLLEAGALLQVNMYSLVKESNERIKARARRMVDARQVSFVGSDAHGSNRRPPAVKDGMAYLYEHTDPAYADAVCFGNAEALLHL